MGKVKQIDIKNRTYYFCNYFTDLENFKSNLLKIDKKSYKSLIFTIFDILELKKLMVVEIFTASIPCIYVLIMRVDISKKKV